MPHCISRIDFWFRLAYVHAFEMRLSPDPTGKRNTCAATAGSYSDEWDEAVIHPRVVARSLGLCWLSHAE